MAAKPDIYQIVTDRIVEAIESEGVLPWQKPWVGSSLPYNGASGHRYKGINLFLLPQKADPRWFTMKQANALGAKVKKGSKSEIVVFWKIMKREVVEDGETKEKSFPLLRYYRVFNIDQLEPTDPEKGWKIKALPKPIEFNPIEICDAVVRGYKGRPKIFHNEQRAYYVPFRDEVNMPDKDTFLSPEAYYHTLFHELIHSTGHPKRLDRLSMDTLPPFGSEDYSAEELVAEIGAAFLSALTGIDNETRIRENQEAYVASWLKRLKNDKKLIISASQKARKASDHIVGDTDIDALKDKFKDHSIESWENEGGYCPQA